MEFHVEKAREEPIPTRKLMILVNDYVVNSCRFFNRFHAVCEEKLRKVSERITRTEITMSILESKINSVDYVAGVTTSAQMTQNLPEVNQTAAAAPAAEPTTAPAADSPGPGMAGPGMAGPGMAGPGMSPQPAAEGAPAEAEVAEAPAGAPKFYSFDKHPDYKHYFLLLRLGVTKATITQKIQVEGKQFDLSILDREPDELTDTPIPDEPEDEE